MLFLRKNEQNIEANKKLGTERLPYFSLLVVPEKGSPEASKPWKEIGAFWKSASGKGYTGQFAKGFEYSTSEIKEFKKSTNTQTND